MSDTSDVKLTVAVLAENVVLNSKNTHDVLGVVDGWAVPKLPIKIPEGKLYLRFQAPSDGKPSRVLHVRVCDPTGKMIVESGGVALHLGSTIEGQPLRGMVAIPVPPFVAAVPGYYSYDLYVDGKPVGSHEVGVHRGRPA